MVIVSETDIYVVRAVNGHTKSLTPRGDEQVIHYKNIITTAAHF